ncbi:T-type calcium channel subunit alpha-1H [Seminavis robusta]|uniref:T-type calcium channel subunit alpha-1H n=1 Tax=Seminavis robusta TaxID=568900 RepID=A0A9N8DIQ7_9STRA|nr:T-type calcium channel subunit alpha-1H [Seminavis robusta]|eukprot:Sro174_g076720.1 T-type calcium channel subunit alpha-1H (431) ;mRNA; r:62701-64091
MTVSHQQESPAEESASSSSKVTSISKRMEQEMVVDKDKVSAKEDDSGITSNTSTNGETMISTNGEAAPSAKEQIADTAAIPSVAEQTDSLEQEAQQQSSSPHNNTSSSSSSSQQHEGSDDEHDEEFHSKFLTWYNPIRYRCGLIVNDERFQFFIVFLIMLNALLMGLATYDFVEKNPKVQKAFELTDTIFLIVFTIECALQLGYHGYQVFYDGWLTFDLVVVLMSWSLDQVQVFRAVRIFRAFRLVARLSVLKDLVNAIVAVLPRIGSIMMLFSLVLYVYAVLCTILFGTHQYGEDNVDYFGRLDYALFTLFQFVTLENWGEISREVMAIYPWAAHIFLSFLMVSSFILYSLVVAVVCDAVAVVEHPDIALKKFEDRMIKEKKETKNRVKRLRDHLGDLSQQQMEMLTATQNRLMALDTFRKDAEESRVL